jgi:hypothetical protein
MLKLLLNLTKKRRTLKRATKIAAGMACAALMNQENHDTDFDFGEIARNSIRLAKRLEETYKEDESN